MRTLDSQEVHFQPTDTRFGPSKIKAVVVFLIFAGIFAIPLVATFQDRQWVPFVFVSILCAIILLTMGNWVAKAFKKDGWKVAIQNSAILLKADITGKTSPDILEIQFHEIVSLHKLGERYILYRGGKSENRTKPVRLDALDIQLAPDAYAQLETLVGVGAKGLEMKSPDRLVYLTGIHMLATDKIISQLEIYCQVREAQMVSYDMPDLKDKKQVDFYILFLARRSHKMDAQQLARKAFGFGLRESKDYVSELLRKTVS